MPTNLPEEQDQPTVEIRTYHVFVTEDPSGCTAVCPAMNESGCGPTAEEAMESLRQRMKASVIVMKERKLEAEIPSDNVITTGSVSVTI